MQKVEIKGHPGCFICTDGTVILPNGRIITEPYNSGQVKLPNGYVALNRLVAEHFVSNPKNYQYLIHLDGNRFNCRADNLEWVVKKFRSTHRVLKDKREKVIWLHTQGHGIPKIVRELGVTYDFVRTIIWEFEEEVKKMSKN